MVNTAVGTPQAKSVSIRRKSVFACVISENGTPSKENHFTISLVAPDSPWRRMPSGLNFLTSAWRSRTTSISLSGLQA